MSEHELPQRHRPEAIELPEVVEVSPFAPPSPDAVPIVDGGKNHFNELNNAKLEQHGQDVKLARSIFALDEGETDDTIVDTTFIDKYRLKHNLPEAVAAKTEVLANTDQLTGLLNRRGFLGKFKELLSGKEINQKRYILMYLDLNGFKAVNDKFGHSEGDKVLEKVAARLKLRKNDLVGRLGGDEFVVLADTEDVEPDTQSNQDSKFLPRRSKKTYSEALTGLTAHIATEVVRGGIEAGYNGISASVGVQEIDTSESAEDIIDAADKKMQQNKLKNGSGR